MCKLTKYRNEMCIYVKKNQAGKINYICVLKKCYII